MWLFEVLQSHYNNELYEEIIFCYSIALDRRLSDDKNDKSDKNDKNEALGQV